MPLFGVQAAGGDDGGGGNDGWDLSGASSGGNQGPDEGVADPLNNGGIVYLETEGDPEDAFDNRPGYSGEDTGSYEGRGYQSDEGGSYQQEEAVEEPSNNDQQQPASILYEFDENDNLIVDLIEDNEFEFEDIFLEGTGCQLPYFVLEFESDISAKAPDLDDPPRPDLPFCNHNETPKPVFHSFKLVSRTHEFLWELLWIPNMFAPCTSISRHSRQLEGSGYASAGSRWYVIVSPPIRVIPTWPP